jgi:D-aminoacyl-tRNA deacylase
VLAIVVSRADSASERIGEALLDAADWKRREDTDRPDADGGGTYHVLDGAELRTFKELHLRLDGVTEAFSDPGLLVFASRHSGETGPLLTAHFTGNLGPAEFGGEDGRLARAAPNAIDVAVSALEEHAPEGYETGIECTHHGPSAVGVPSLFVEVGSDEPQWKDETAARAVARVILALGGVDPDCERTVVGFGGGHYAPRFLRIVEETPWTVGHVGADWALSAMGDPRENPDVVDRAFERSGATRAVIDGEYPELEAVVSDLGYEVVSETWLREVGDRPLDLVAAIEDALGPVGTGTRFGNVRPTDEDSGDPAEAVVVRAFPEELLREAQGIDPEATRAAVEARAVAFRTREGASRAADRVALASDPDPEETFGALVEDLAALLRDKYDAVRVGTDAVVATETAFSPELAETVGVTQGPAFGRLADGETVEVGGREIPPEAVHEERTHRFCLFDP